MHHDEDQLPVYYKLLEGLANQFEFLVYKRSDQVSTLKMENLLLCAYHFYQKTHVNLLFQSRGSAIISLCQNMNTSLPTKLTQCTLLILGGRRIRMTIFFYIVCDVCSSSNVIKIRLSWTKIINHTKCFIYRCKFQEKNLILMF